MQFLNKPYQSIIASPKKMFIFFRPAKVAGTSIVRDIMASTVGDLIVFPKQRNAESKKWFRKLMLDKDLFDAYFKFAIVRNPWDRVVSAYAYFTRLDLYEDDFESFVHFIKELHNDEVEGDIFTIRDNLRWHTYPQDIYFYDSNDVFVDFIGRYENIDEDWAFIAERCGLSPVLFHINKSTHEHYTYYYTKRTRKIIARLYKKEIDLLGYVNGE